MFQTSSRQVWGRCQPFRDFWRGHLAHSCSKLREMRHCRGGQSRVHRRRQRGVHPQRGDRPVQLPGAGRRPGPGAARRQRRAAPPRPGPRPPHPPPVRAARRPVLDGARYAINEIQVGGYDATRLDFDIPARYGVRQTIADTLGIGGIFRGLRTIPVVTGLAEDMHRLCPGAYLLNYTNPMAMLPWAVYEGTPFTNVFGLCHSVRDTHRFLAGLVGFDPADVDFRTAGFNHQAFVLRFEHQGQSLYPRLREIIDASPELQRRVRVELFRRFGYFPTESSEHSAEYVPWF